MKLMEPGLKIEETADVLSPRKLSLSTTSAAGTQEPREKDGSQADAVCVRYAWLAMVVGGLLGDPDLRRRAARVSPIGPGTGEVRWRGVDRPVLGHRWVDRTSGRTEVGLVPCRRVL